MAYESEPITAIRLSRGACFGTCPIYELMLHSNGTADWIGERFVERIGQFHGEFDPNDFDRLARFVERAGFFNWAEDNQANVSDLPDYVLTVVAGARTKSVLQNGVDEPPDFWVVAEVVDGIGAAIEWTQASAATGCREWSATLTDFGVVAPMLRVRGVCTFPTGGFEVELSRHDPQPEDPGHLLLDRLVTEPTGPVTQAFTDIQVVYQERSGPVERVTILPDGATVDVEVLSAPPPGTDSEE